MTLGLAADPTAAASTADPQAIDLLSVSLCRSVESVGRKARLIAESANRTEVIEADIEMAMREWDDLIGSAAPARPLPPLKFGLSPPPEPSSTLFNLPQYESFANTAGKRGTNFPPWLQREIEGVKEPSTTIAAGPPPAGILPNGLAEEEAKQLLAKRVMI